MPNKSNLKKSKEMYTLKGVKNFETSATTGVEIEGIESKFLALLSLPDSYTTNKDNNNDNNNNNNNNNYYN